ncbi:MAG: type II toxin-antitoxin system RatA family toxin [Alphaproteobacteria bacterium]|nr:type II toxin-antitoxin system RatA family toxin [Alphaproteobacteria bacterium]
MSAEHVERLRLRHRPDDLFDLVSDVRAYPKFIKLISAMRVTRDQVEEGTGVLDAEARVRYRFVREKFSTRVRLDRSERLIDVDYIAGPFHDLANQWRFHALDDGSTLVDFWIRYRFGNPVLQMLVDTNRTRAIRYLIGAFEEEARRRYETVGTSEYPVDEALKKFEAAGR